MARFLRSLGSSLFLLVACNNAADTTIQIIPATAVAVDPANFLGGVACVAAPGAMQSYVATLYEASGTPKTGIVRGPPLMSSLPTPCFRSVLFQNIVLGQQYVATVDGYAYPADALTPKEPGGAVLLRRNDAGGNTEVAPGWRTNCGFANVVTVVPASRNSPTDAGLSEDGGARDGSVRDASVPSPKDAGVSLTPLEPATRTADSVDASCATPYLLHPLPDGAAPQLDGPVCAVSEATMVLACAPLLPVGPSVTGVTVNLGQALGSCGTAAGNVDAVSVRVRGTSSDGPATVGQCAANVAFGGLEPSSLYTFDVIGTAVNEGGTAMVTTTCYATTIAGVVVSATCDPFVTP